ncbi:unnamed protein product [Linum trigynum]|uniref:Uncharacterized protein n=1 Tax=Linum trigynum TaxID=586398 RepID=A0AAV2EUS6_9ROSI
MAKLRLCVFRNALASSGDETTTFEVSPNLRCIIPGSYCRAKSRSRRWGREEERPAASWCRGGEWIWSEEEEEF